MKAQDKRASKPNVDMAARIRRFMNKETERSQHDNEVKRCSTNRSAAPRHVMNKVSQTRISGSHRPAAIRR